MCVILLKPQDLTIALELGLEPGKARTLSEVARAVQLSASEVHAGISRAEAADLVDAGERRIVVRNLMEFLEHGVRYTFISRRGGVTRGIPTAHSAAPLASELAGIAGSRKRYADGRAKDADDAASPETLSPLQSLSDVPVVWPHPEGTMRGESLEPLYPTAVDAAIERPRLHECLALVDALRVGRAREREMGARMLRARLAAK
jgi:hypothetical protein